jgi:hypothetical protein
MDGRLAMMVMPAAYRVDLTRLSCALGGGMVERARNRVRTRSPIAVGAMPPFATLRMPVYVDSRPWQPEIAFNAGSHTDGCGCCTRSSRNRAAGIAVAGACDVANGGHRSSDRSASSEARLPGEPQGMAAHRHHGSTDREVMDRLLKDWVRWCWLAGHLATASFCEARTLQFSGMS